MDFKKTTWKVTKFCLSARKGNDKLSLKAHPASFQRVLTGPYTPFLLPQVLRLKISQYLAMKIFSEVAIKRLVLAFANTVAPTCILFHFTIRKLLELPHPHDTSTSLFLIWVNFFYFCLSGIDFWWFSYFPCFHLNVGKLSSRGSWKHPSPIFLRRQENR